MRRPRFLVALAAVLAVLLGVLTSCGTDTATAPGSTAAPLTTFPARTDPSGAGATGSADATTTTAAPVTATTRATTTAAPATTRAEGVSGLPTITLDELPDEALDTLDLIDEGGPFPYDRDGITFQNRERLLPGRPRGYYREYTVRTPGESDRGARRIVTGDDGERYYTDDHYESFREIVG